MELGEERQAYLAAGLMACAVFAGGMAMLFCDEVERLPLRKAPVAPPPEETVTRQLRFNPQYYASLLKEDSAKFGVAAPSVEEMSRPLPHHVEFSGRQRLRPGRKGGLETKHLRMSLKITKDWAQAVGGGFTADHAVLTIVNKTDRYLAYRVETEVPDARRCRNKSNLAHHAIALTPQEQISRTECALDPMMAVWVTRVEVIELPPLSYHYLGRLRPVVLLLNERTSGGHVAGRRKPCDPIAWVEIKAGAEAKETTWADVVDFYARHSCDEYTFFRGYKQQTGTVKLPARRGR